MNKKVLIVDDDPRNIFALTLTLKAKGYQIESCTMAQEAIDFFKKRQSIFYCLNGYDDAGNGRI